MPSVDEINTNTSFVGSGARFISQKLGAIKYFRDFHHRTLIDFRPPGGNFELVETDPKKMQQLMVGVQDIRDLILQHKPHIVVCFGEKVMKYLMGKTDVAAWRGHVEWSKDLDCKIMATYDPIAAIRQRFNDKSDKPGQWDILCQTDIGKAIGESFSAILTRPPATIVIAKDYLTMISEIKKLWEAKALAFDIETSGYCITCISFAPSANYSVCIPLRNVYPGSVVANILPPDQQSEVWFEVKKLLESPIPKIAQNSQFDMTILLKFYEIRVCNLIWDTMVAAHNTYCDLPKDLGTLISIYSTHPQHKQMGASSNFDEFWEYNARDSMVTFDIYENQRKEMEELGILDHYIQVTNPLIPCLVDMQCVGVKVDLAMRDAAVAREKQVAQVILGGLNTLFQKWFPDGFNPNSPLDMKALFYGNLNLKPIYNKGSVTTDADAREEFIKRLQNRSPVMVAAIKLIGEYLAARHLISVLGQTLMDDRLNTAYDAAGTDTGRLNSRKSVLGTGGNLQNLQVGPPRQMLIPG